MKTRSTRTRILLLPMALFAVAASLSPTQATCSGGFNIYLAGQLPDVTFTSGIPTETIVDPWYVSMPAASGGSCGIFARSTTPGVSIRQTYGCFPPNCPVMPPGEWAAVGDAYSTFFDTVSHKGTDIPLVFDGSAPPGTYGTIEIGIRDNDAGIPNHAMMGKVNVYVTGETAPATWFNVTSTEDNVSGDRVLLDHPYLNGNSGANLFISHLSNPGGTTSGTTWNHPIGVTWDGSSGRWSIRNLDGFPMAAGLAFGVRYDPAADLYCTSTFPFPYTSVQLWSPGANFNPWATILVTPVDGSPHPVAVEYRSDGMWYLVHSDGATIPPGTCFNVKIFPFSQYVDHPASGDLSQRTNTRSLWATGEDVGGNGTGHNWGQRRNLQFDWALGRPSGQLMVTYNATPMGWDPYFEPWYFGVQAPSAATFGERWSIYRENGTSMSVGARFNTWAPCGTTLWYPDADGDGWGVEGTTQTSCGRPTGYAAMLGDCDDTDATKYPGSPEVNDGQDNQCAGEPGSGTADEIGTIVFTDRYTMCWPEQAGASVYEVARSNYADFDSCFTLFSITDPCAADESSISPGAAYHYLVRAGGPWTGSWGADSAGTERVPECP